MRNSHLSRFIQILKQQGTNPFGLTPQKVRERADVVEADCTPEQVAIEMERHPGLLVGTDRGCFVIKYMRYIADLPSGKIRELDTDRPWKLVVNPHEVARAYADLSFSFESNADGSFSVTDSTSTMRDDHIATLEDLEAFAVRIVESLHLSFEFEDVKHNVPAAVIDRHLADIKKALKARAREVAQEEWEFETSLG